MTQYIRTPFTLLLSAVVVLLLLQVPHGNPSDERTPNALVLVEGVFELEPQQGLMSDPDRDSALPSTFGLHESAARREPAAGFVHATVRFLFNLPPSRAPPAFA